MTKPTKAGQRGASRQGQRTVSGVVTSDRMDKTLTVLVERRVQHPMYSKIIRRSTKLHAHDERNEGRVGDTVTVEACRPVSKTKSWRLKSVDQRAAVA